MSGPSKIRLSFHTFPTTWGIILLTDNMHFFSNTEIKSNNSRYYNLATVCAQSTNTVFVYKPKSNPLKVVDIRVLRYILLETQLAQYNDIAGDTTLLEKCMYAFGLFGLHDQQLGNNKKRPIENFGAILDIDAECIKFISRLFNTTIDGYITPNMSPGTTHHVCIFNKEKMESRDEITTSPEQMVVGDLTSISKYLKMPKISIELYLKANSYNPFGGINKLAKNLMVGSGKHKIKQTEKQIAGVPGAPNAPNTLARRPSSAPPLTTSTNNVAQLFIAKEPESVKLITAEIITDPLIINSIQYDELEEQIETSGTTPTLQCKLSESQILKEFIGKVFILLTCILHESLNIVIQETIEKTKEEIIRHTLHYHYRPLVEHRSRKSDKVDVYVLKPGMSRFLSIGVVDDIIALLNKNNKEESEKAINQMMLNSEIHDKNDMFFEILEKLTDKYATSEILGAIYGITTHAGMFSLIYQACVTESTGKNTFLLKLKPKFKIVLTNLQGMFGLPTTYNEVDLLKLLQTNTEFFKNTVCDKTYFTEDGGAKCKRKNNPKPITEPINILNVSKNNLSKIVLDMMITQNNQDMKGISIARRNLNNQEYIRTRRDKKIGTYKHVTKVSTCPVFHTITDKETKSNYNIMMVNGDEWYEVVPNGLFQNIMTKYNRTCKAGPSGSTLMLMNMVFGLFGNYITPSERNQKMLLLCMISDFVPVYHSLTEVLMIYSREYILDKPNPKFAYTIDQNPVEWLVNHFKIKTKNPVVVTLDELAIALLNTLIVVKPE